MDPQRQEEEEERDEGGDGDPPGDDRDKESETGVASEKQSDDEDKQATRADACGPKLVQSGPDSDIDRDRDDETEGASVQQAEGDPTGLDVCGVKIDPSRLTLRSHVKSHNFEKATVSKSKLTSTKKTKFQKGNTDNWPL